VRMSAHKSRFEYEIKHHLYKTAQLIKNLHNLKSGFGFFKGF